jgi:hypothetical protein
MKETALRGAIGCVLFLRLFLPAGVAAQEPPLPLTPLAPPAESVPPSPPPTAVPPPDVHETPPPGPAATASPRSAANPEPAAEPDADTAADEAARAGAAEKPAAEGLPALAEKTKGLERRDGLLPLYVDAKRGRLWLELPPPGARGVVGEYLYVEGILTGLGSNPVGLDRGQLGETRVVALRRVGGRLLVEEQNTRYRARTEDPDEARAVRESFATSVLWAGEIAAEDPDGRWLVDFTSFVVRDAHDVAATLRTTGQGAFRLDEGRSAVDVEACLAFPENLELEALLTFTGEEPGSLVRSVAPTAQAVTLVQHHSLLKLPDAGYRPRRFDPRAGSFAIGFADYAAPLGAPLETRWIVRQRLEKLDPSAKRSRVKRPLVFHVDRGAPEPVRTALIEGAAWWARAFEAAGFEDAFRVELLPEGVHPLDARYHVIQWVHRSTRGWSYGGGVIDPRTGELIKGHVSLGSLRVRHDRLLFEGLLGTEGTGKGGAEDPVQIALARIRQLSAHEVGHTLGLAHNFAASTYGRASVMDYPAPLVGITQTGELDLSDAYGVGVGEWDVHAIRYAYSEFPPGADEAAELEVIVQDGLARGLAFLSDADARAPGAAHPLANLWDNGTDPAAELEHALEVRRIALGRFGERNVAPGTPLALLQEVLAPLYFHHRYQLDAAVKLLGGMTYSYALRGDGQPLAQPVAAGAQRRALEVVLRLFEPEVLDLPEPVLALLLPRPMEYWPGPELFGGSAAPAFDPLGAAAAAADMAARGLLQRERMARLVDFHRRDESQPALEEVLDVLLDRVFEGRAEPERHRELRRTVQRVVVDALLDLSADPAVAAAVRTRLDGKLRELLNKLESTAREGFAESAHRASLRADIARALARDAAEPAVRPRAPRPPPGSPIGMMQESCSAGP